ncbi:DMT family transporter [Halobellus captivus]|uniref:DMT family transporter n=1 Tax=Halobellus captivus TaxID=2592614 RepID=UPI0011A970CA|nr:EamA family transporter [Halobellus captivus]
MVEISHLLAVGLAIGAAVSSATSNLSVRQGTDSGRTKDAIFVVSIVNVLVLLPIVAVRFYPEYGLTRLSLVSFAIAGILGTLIGRALNFASIDKIGASRTAPILASWALISTVLGVIFLGETLTAIHGVGIFLVVGGVAVIAWKTSNDNPEDLPRPELLIGLLIPFGAAVAVGWEPIFANVGFDEGTPPLVGLAVKSIAAALGFALYLWWDDDLPDRSVVRGTNARWFVFAGLTNTLFLLGYYVALSIAPVNIVSPIVVTNTLFVVVLAALFMPERLERVTWQIMAAALVVVAGVLLITAFG